MSNKPLLFQSFLMGGAEGDLAIIVKATTVVLTSTLVIDRLSLYNNNNNHFRELN